VSEIGTGFNFVGHKIIVRRLFSLQSKLIILDKGNTSISCHVLQTENNLKTSVLQETSGTSICHLATSHQMECLSSQTTGVSSLKIYFENILTKHICMELVKLNTGFVSLLEGNHLIFEYGWEAGVEGLEDSAVLLKIIFLVPFDEMWPDDKYWFPMFLEGQKFSGYFLFEGHDKILKYTLDKVDTI
jgi:hypothetical protein